MLTVRYDHQNSFHRAGGDRIYVDGHPGIIDGLGFRSRPDPYTLINKTGLPIILRLEMTKNSRISNIPRHLKVPVFSKLALNFFGDVLKV